MMSSLIILSYINCVHRLLIDMFCLSRLSWTICCDLFRVELSLNITDNHLYCGLKITVLCAMTTFEIL